MLRSLWLVLGICTTMAAGALSADESQMPHWDYGQNDGPARWASLSSQYAVCAEGRAQSPIDLEMQEASPRIPNVAFDYRPSALRIVRQTHVVGILNNGHTIQLNPDGESTLDLDGSRFRLIQYHFHAPSEHSLDGRRFPMEVHAVHRNDAGELAVVGIFVRAGAADPTIAKLWAHIPESEDTLEHHADVEVTPGALIADEFSVYRYLGSLTTPPCSEGVRWLVIAEPVELSREQIAAFEALYGGNNRPIQARNGRAVERLNIRRPPRE